MLLKNLAFAVAPLAVLAPCCAAHAALRPTGVAAQAAGSADKQTELDERLLAAVKRQPMDVVEVEAPLKAGAKVNAKDNDGWTPQHFAAVKGHAEVVTVLLKAGADPRETDSAGKWPHVVATDDNCRDLLWNAMIEKPLKSCVNGGSCARPS